MSLENGFESKAKNHSAMSGDLVSDHQEDNWDELFLFLSKVLVSIMAFMCVAGVLMNCISLFIFTRPSLRKRSINILLCGLSASDVALCALILPVFSLSQLHTFIPGLSQKMLMSILVYLYPLTWMAQTMSIWMLVGITIDRWLAICRPFSMRLYCSVGRAQLTVASTFLFSIGYNFVRFWEYQLDNDGEIVFALRSNYYYMLWYQNIATLLTQFALPLGFMSVLNLQVAKEILVAQQTRRELVSALERREHKTSKMMLYVVLVFIFCYSLSFCLNVLEMLFPEMFRSALGFMLNDATNLLVVLNSSSSFIFYTQCSRRYREELHSVFHRIDFARVAERRDAMRRIGETSYVLTLSEHGAVMNQQAGSSDL